MRNFWFLLVFMIIGGIFTSCDESTKEDLCANSTCTTNDANSVCDKTSGECICMLNYTLNNSGVCRAVENLGGFIGGHLRAKEEVLRAIPEEYINYARENFQVAYQHTSHGTHVSRGMFGLVDYKNSNGFHDSELFAITGDGIPQVGKLNFNDSYLSNTTMDAYDDGLGGDADDLSTSDETLFIGATRQFLDAPENANYNVIMWSWCNIANHDVEGVYLPGITTLVSEYGEGGSKIGTGAGQRVKPVHFILMTGHANANDNIGEGLTAMPQARRITEYCNRHQLYCLDYYSIDTHAMDDTYYEDAGDNGQSASYPDGSNFYQDWQDTHTLGEDWYEARHAPGGDVEFAAHNTQHITANRKAYAMWWILARLAGWDGN